MSTTNNMPTTNYEARLPLEVQVPPPLLTAADLATMPTELPSGVVSYELDNGRLVMMSPPAYRHAQVQLRIGAELFLQGEKPGHGQSGTEATVVLWQQPDRVVVPDVVFIAKKSFPLLHSPEGYLRTIPTLVVEVRSQNDLLPYLERKVADYLRAGVEQVWIADPAAQTIVVQVQDASPRAFAEKNVITDECFAAIPGLRLVLAEIFQTA